LIFILKLLIIILTFLIFRCIFLITEGSEGMKKIISRCPVCDNQLKVTRLKCESCNTVIENDFALSRFDYLTDEELHFTETFIRCRGNIKEVEKELGISYPTVRAKLDGIIKALGFEEEKTCQDEEALRREKILRELEAGNITAAQALEMLK